MPHVYAHAVELVTTALTVAGLGYYAVALVAAYLFLAERRKPLAPFAPGVTVLKSLKGFDPGMMEAFRSHCRQSYAGEYELLFGVASLDDPAVEAVHELQREFPERAIRLFECPERLGTNGKVSTLVQLQAHAAHEYLVINDSDITVSSRYLERVMAHFAPENRRGGRETGLVTALYRGRPEGTPGVSPSSSPSLGSRLESLGISTDFIPSVLLTKWMERGLRFGLGSTLAVSRKALAAAGGLEGLVDQLADDYEMGVRVYRAGFRVALASEAVETSVPAYQWRGFVEHQLRWYRTVRDARPAGYVGIIFTNGLPLALLNLLASGASPLSVWLLALSFFLRLTLAMTVGATVLSDHEVLPNLWLLPFRDCVAVGLWIAGFAGNTIVWRGERFVVRKGKLEKAGTEGPRDRGTKIA